ncbi:amidase [Sulfodiicoccus acidiphilus]|uniref:Amidase n=1 Tax=Sulfodiicoccus acidiphilus TaxID=1670455 RepID=A0A348B6D6_9CREN|nr:amidase [Sulfodiicoccus acidiphilus]BBD73738.1 amidase [Sulfodiicoccus acidiphilus]GGT97986.1 amidase [Sulfodiicoccus acidiphilus]
MKFPLELETTKPKPVLLLKEDEVRRGVSKPIEEASRALDSARRENNTFNDYITINDAAVEDATALERELKSGAAPPLAGLPISVKDMILTRGLRTTMGSSLFKDFVPSYDAEVVSRLREAGALIVGKTNLHEFASGVTNLSSVVGPARNPRDPARITGGSSGGSAASVALGSAIASLGTDTSGSVRIPAALCGVVGYKPTYDLLSRDGVFPLAWSLDHVGLLAKTVPDVAYVANVLEGRTGRIDVEWAVRGIEPEDLNLAYLDVDIGFYQNVVTQLGSRGVRITKVALDLEKWNSLQRVVRLVEAASVHRGWFSSNPEAYSPDVAALLKEGLSFRAVDYVDSLRARREVMDEFLRETRGFHALLTPTISVVAPSVNEVEGRELQFRTVATKYVSFANYLGVPAISVPAGSLDGLPVAVQLVGRPYEDSVVLAAARTLETLLS